MDAGEIVTHLIAQVDDSGFKDYAKAQDAAVKNAQKVEQSVQRTGRTFQQTGQQISGMSQLAQRAGVTVRDEWERVEKATARSQLRAQIKGSVDAFYGIGPAAKRGVGQAEKEVGRLSRAFQGIQKSKAGGFASSLASGLGPAFASELGGTTGALGALTSGLGAFGLAAGAAAAAAIYLASSSTTVASEAKDAAQALLEQQIAMQGVQGADLDVADANLTVTESMAAYKSATDDVKTANRELGRVLHGQPKWSQAAKESAQKIADANYRWTDSTQRVRDAQDRAKQSLDAIDAAQTTARQKSRDLSLAQADLKARTDDAAAAHKAAGQAVKDYGSDSTEAAQASRKAESADKAVVSAKRRVENATRAAQKATDAVATAQHRSEEASKAVTRAEREQRHASQAVTRAKSEYRHVLAGLGKDSPQYAAAVDKVNAALLRQSRADMNVTRAQQQRDAAMVRQRQAQDAAQVATQKFAKELGGLTSKIEENGRQQVVSNGRGASYVKQAATAAQKAHSFATALVEAAQKNKDFDASNVQTAQSIAGVVENLGRMPTKAEAKIIADATGANEQIAIVDGKLERVENTNAEAFVNADTAEANSRIDETQGKADTFDQTKASATLTTTDNASPTISAVSAKLASLNGDRATTYIDVIRREYGTTPGSAGGGNPNPKPKARGGPANRPEVALIGEDGPEVVVPVGQKHRGDGMRWLAFAAKALGVGGMAKGGAAGWWTQTKDGQDSPEAKRRNKTLAILQKNIDLAALTPGTGDDIRAYRRLAGRLGRDLAFAQRHGAPASVISDVATALKSARDTLTGLQGDRVDGTTTAREDQLNARLALAGLTRSPRDDIAAQRALLGYHTRQLRAAQRRHAPPSVIADLANKVASDRSALADLTGNAAQARRDQTVAVRDARVVNLQKQLSETQGRAVLAESFGAALTGGADLGFGGITINVPTVVPGDTRSLRAVAAAAAQGVAASGAVRSPRIRA